MSCLKSWSSSPYKKRGGWRKLWFSNIRKGIGGVGVRKKLWLSKIRNHTAEKYLTQPRLGFFENLKAWEKASRPAVKKQAVSQKRFVDFI